MMGQNSFSNTTNTTVDVQEPANQIMVAQRDTTSTKIFSPKNIIIFVIAALIGAGITAAIFLLFINRQPVANGPTAPIEYASQDNDDSEIKEDTTKNIDNNISSSTDETEKLSLKLNKVDYYQIDEEYDKALEILNDIDINSLDSDDKYRVYTYYIDIYEGKNDTAQVEYYESLANETLNQAYPE
jgi:lipopolysaccharide export LptBFGC system permease protein LptF